MKKSKTVIGSKDLMRYLEWIAHEFVSGNVEELTIAASGTNINKLERIIKIFTELSKYPIVEKSRNSEPFRGMQSVECILIRKVKK